MLLRKVEVYKRDDGLVDKVKLKMGKTNVQNVGGAALNKPVTLSFSFYTPTNFAKQIASFCRFLHR